MMLGALVLAAGIVGMTKASAMRRPSTPRTRNSESTTASLSRPIAQGPYRVEIAQARLTSELRSVFPAHSLRWDYPALDQVEVCWLRREVEAQFDAGRQGIDVGLFRQKVWLDLERASRLRASDPEIASAEGPHETREEGEGVRWDHVPGGDLVRDQRHLCGKDHQIGPGKCGPAFPETRGASEIVVRGRQRMLRLKAQAPYPDMVLEVSANPRQVDEGLDAEMLEVSMWTNA